MFSASAMFVDQTSGDDLTVNASQGGHHIGEPDRIERLPKMMGPCGQIELGANFSNPRIRKPPWFIHCLMVLNGCSARLAPPVETGCKVRSTPM